ncbi:SMP-30/gluconolactonase/LRE family protein [Variovorax sp. J22P271]|uniref:SMP-30/gluconolactonase/LRE family protein n=1 Tax=Variovorax davisae TaxID=3053515 RepID=UPI0025752121|nr:SMP-30/gluconolactonase/LRE family protein [Variovorax sp. J22P271]MDM0037218.1 SMP-30/gluconolactonase/LRE family protein [Variovorax sp. J22P271]
MTDNVRCVINVRDRLGETPLWCPRTEKLWWIDIDRPRLQSFDERSGRHEVHRFEGHTFLGGQALHRQGGFVIALDNSLYRFEPGDGRLEHLVDVEPASKGTRLNDGRCDSRGRLWIGTADVAFREPLGSFYRVGPDARAQWQFDDIIVTNSIAIAPDERTLYMSDTRRCTIWAFDFDVEDGVLSNRRVFADYANHRGRPDGACVDSEGCLWNAAFAGGCVIRYTPAGKVDRVIELPVTNPTCVCLGGPGLRTLYITSSTNQLTPAALQNEPLAGALLAVEVDVPGLPEQMYGTAP